MARSASSSSRRRSISSMTGSSPQASKKLFQSPQSRKCWRPAASASTPSMSKTTAGPAGRAPERQVQFSRGSSGVMGGVGPRGLGRGHSARLMGVAVDRLTLPIPYGHHDYVDDPAVVIVAGNLFAPVPGASPDVGATLVALPRLDAALADDVAGREALAARGVTVASDVMLQVATASGVRDLAVAAGRCGVDPTPADPSDRADAARLEDPTALARFVASRVLYRRLGAWVWLPVLGLAVIDLANSLFRVINHLTHEHVHVRTPHTASFWGNLVVNLLAVTALEALVVAVAGLLVRRRFRRDARAGEPPTLVEPLALTLVDEVDALELARRVCEAPGPSRAVVVERRGRLGLPPVFDTVERLGVVEVEAASAIQVRLLGGEARRRRGSLLERLVGGGERLPGPAAATLTMGSWPDGRPFPMALERLREQRHRRVVRRLAGAALALTIVAHVARGGSVAASGVALAILALL